MNRIEELKAALLKANASLKEARKNPPPMRKVTGIRIGRTGAFTDPPASKLQQRVWEISGQLQEAYVERVAVAIQQVLAEDDGKWYDVVWDNADLTPSGTKTRFGINTFGKWRDALAAIMQGRNDLSHALFFIEERPL